MLLRVMTYNIHKCIGGLDRRYRPGRICETISFYEPDIVLLQEVDEGVARSDGHRQVDLLGELLGYRHRTFFSNVRVWGGGHYGNAILSRFPFTETRNIDLTIPPMKRRSVLHARFRIRPGGHAHSRTLQVFNLHLGLSQILRRLQIRRFLASHPFAGCHPRTPVLVGGDFNDVWGTLGDAYLGPAGFRGAPQPPRTFPAFAPFRALDGIYVRGDLELRTLQRPRIEVARAASDHLPLIADVALA